MEASKYWLAMLKGEKLDRIPIVPMCIGHCAKVMGKPNLGDYYAMPKFNYQAQILTRELYRYDQPTVVWDFGNGSECWGSKIMYPYGPKMGSIIVTESAVKGPADLDKIEIPEPRNAPHWNEFHESMKLSVEGKQMPIVLLRGSLVSSTAPHLVTLETFLMWMYEEPELVKKALNMTAEYGLRVTEAFVKDFGNYTFLPFAGTPTDSNVLISPDFFGEYPLPVVKNMYRKILNMGIENIFIHWCSDHNKNIERGYVEEIPVGPNAPIHFGPEVSMELQVKRFGKRYNILGNSNPPLMMTSTPEEWLQICKKNIDIGKQSEKVFSICVGCELPPPAPPCNVLGMTKAAELYGRYEKK
jgi:uroporphyrinogen decarboxylase